MSNPHLFALAGTPVRPGACYGPAEKLIYVPVKASGKTVYRRKQETSSIIVTIIAITAGLVLIILVAALYAKFCRRRPHDPDTPHDTNPSTANTRVNTHSTVSAIARVATNSTEPAVAVAVMLNPSAIQAGEVIPVAKTVDFNT